MPGIKKVSIDQQLAEIGVRVTPAQMHITRPRMQMKISTESPQMEIDRQNPSFKVNWKKVRSESGLKPQPELTRNVSNEGKSTAMRRIKEIGKEGDFLGDLRIPMDRGAKLSRSKAMNAATRKKEINIGLMPQSSPEVTWDKGHLRINWSKHSILIDWDGEYMPQVTIDPKSSIEIFLRTEPYFRIRVEDVVDPNMPGRYVDQAI